MAKEDKGGEMKLEKGMGEQRWNGVQQEMTKEKKQAGKSENAPKHFMSHPGSIRTERKDQSKSEMNMCPFFLPSFHAGTVFLLFL